MCTSNLVDNNSFLSFMGMFRGIGREGGREKGIRDIILIVVCKYCTRIITDSKSIFILLQIGISAKIQISRTTIVYTCRCVSQILLTIIASREYSEG
jgi:hypothetical protein